MINNIDVTLRDGGYQNNFSFPVRYATEHVSALVKSGVEWIEIGYRNGSFKPIPNIGITGMAPDEYIQQIHSAVPDAKLVVIAHPHNITNDDVVNIKQHGVKLLRICIKPENTRPALALCEFAKKIGLKVSINITRVSQIDVNTLISLANICESAGADIICLADSNGSLHPMRVTQLVNVLKCTTNVEIGYHAHDNLGLAMANSIVAVKAGATFIDSSLAGMGKGAGNLCMEAWLSFCNFNSELEIYQTEIIFKQVQKLQSQDFFNASHRNVVDMILGLKNLSVEYRKEIEENLIKDIYSNHITTGMAS